MVVAKHGRRMRSSGTSPQRQPDSRPTAVPPAVVAHSMPPESCVIEWLIIGGGINGTHIATRLVADGGLPSSCIRILDPAERLLSRWREYTATTGMRFLRSPSVHHIGLEPYGLLEFAGDPHRPSPEQFAPPYVRPSLSLFNAHCDHIIKRYRLGDMHIRGKASAITIPPSNSHHKGDGAVPGAVAHVDEQKDADGLDHEGADVSDDRHHDGGVIEMAKDSSTHGRADPMGTSSVDTSPLVRVDLECGKRLLARHVVLAIGSGGEPSWPCWAPRDHPLVHHVFQDDFDGWPEAACEEKAGVEGIIAHGCAGETVVVVGGGISAAHVALRLVKDGHMVHVIARHSMRTHQFDTDAGWVGPKYMDGFLLVTDMDKRRSIIEEARTSGSVTPQVAERLEKAKEEGKVIWHVAEVEELMVGTISHAPSRFTIGGDARPSCQAGGVDPMNQKPMDDHAGKEPISAHARGGLWVSLNTGESIWVDRVLLATGFQQCCPGGALVDSLAASARLPRASDGYPVVDRFLRWGGSLVHVAGALADLELGPVARNITGARRAADRILECVRGIETARGFKIHTLPLRM